MTNQTANIILKYVRVQNGRIKMGTESEEEYCILKGNYGRSLS